MRSRYDEAHAREAIDRWGAAGEAVALRVYTSRLIGAEPELVLHGGGNTSVKGVRRTLLGDEPACLWVKGSGSSLDRVEPRDFPALDLAYLLRLRTLDSLTDEEMVNQLRTHLFDASAPNPSVEALLHAFLPQTFVDHSHADAILVLTNQPDGESLVKEALGDDVLVLPYIMPGFPLAKAVAEAFERAPRCRGIVLGKHGLFTFGASARESYEAHVALVDGAERYAERRARPVAVSMPGPTALERRARAVEIAPILRGLLANGTGVERQRFVLELRDADAEASAVDGLGAADLFATGPLTPDQVIRTKAMPLVTGPLPLHDRAELERVLAARVGHYRAEYDAYFERCSAERGVRRTKLDSAPRVVLVHGVGVLAFGVTKKDARIAGDLAQHTLRAKRRVAAFGTYEALGELDLFDMEYWSLEQAKLGKAARRPLEGQVALVTGAAGAIGAGIAERCAAAGAHLVVTDRDGARAQSLAAALVETFGAGSAIGLETDVTDDASVRLAFDAACAEYGGVDLVVPNAGIALVRPIAELSSADARRVADVNYIGVLSTIREAARVMAAQRTGGAIVVNASKNVFAPGKDFGAYSASKAAALQLAKVAAIELAPLGVRVNMINADAVFGQGAARSGMWDEIGPGRAKSRGLDLSALPDFYRERSLLKVAVEARHVGDAVVFLAAGAPVTTGATLPIDAGVPEAFPR